MTSTVLPTPPDRTTTSIDVRGPRVSAAITATVLALAMVVQGPVGIVLVGIQVVVFAAAVTRGVARSPWAMAFRAIRRVLDLGPPPAVEDPTPPRVAQACGLVVAGTGLMAMVGGVPTLGWVLVGVVLGLSTLLATSGLCVGCELYVLGLRLRRQP